MKVQNRTKLALVILLVLCMLVPTVSARRKTLVKIITIPDFDYIPFDNSEEMPNGFTKVDICYKFFWYDLSMNKLGYAYQYITGIEKTGSGNDFSSLHGYGVFYSEVDGKSGTITYKIGNARATRARAPKEDRKPRQTPEGPRKTPGNHLHQPFKQNSS